MSAAFVRRYYNVPAKRGDRVSVNGRAGHIVGFKRARLRVRFEDTGRIEDAHPTWEVEYLDAEMSTS